MANNTRNPGEMQREILEKREKIFEKREKNLIAIIAKHDKRLNDLQSSAFSLANYYFVFQGVILTIVCNGAQNLKPSNRWFLLTLSILAVLVNSCALIQNGIKYIETKASQERFSSRLNGLTLEEGIPCDEKDKNSGQSKIEDYIKYKRNKRYFYLAIYIIIFLGFAAVVLVGCWKFLGNQNEQGYNRYMH
ncbi:ATP-dependent RNA helicase ddx56 [Fagus crenata]